MKVTSDKDSGNKVVFQIRVYQCGEVEESVSSQSSSLDYVLA